MRILVEHGRIEQNSADTLVVNLFEGVNEPEGATGAVDQALQGAIKEIIQNGDFAGKLGEVAVIYPQGKLAAKRVLVVGLGKRESFDADCVRRAMASAVRRARELNANEVATIVHGSGQGGLSASVAAQAVVEGAILGLYKFTSLKKADEQEKEIQTLKIIEFNAEQISSIEEGIRIGEAVAQGVTLARDLVNMPPNVATPTKMASTADEIASEFGMTLLIGDREWAAEHNMGAFLGVAKGAGEPPKFIILEHNPDKNSSGKPIVIVGKGITFDTGGISLKPSQNMGAMKSDMAGAAAVLGTMKVVGSLNLPIHVVGIAPCTENMPDANAYHPADVVTASNDKSIEIISTDAEGRLILADALVYAQRYHPKAVVDLATLTGACVIALGREIAAGLFTNDDSLKQRLLESSSKTSERIWPMPLYDDYSESIKSDVADIKNSGGRMGGVGTSAAFLKEFVSFPWAHIDIAGMALSEKGKDYISKGATGFGVRLLIQFLRDWKDV